jgi:hypothetical protein
MKYFCKKKQNKKLKILKRSQHNLPIKIKIPIFVYFSFVNWIKYFVICVFVCCVFFVYCFEVQIVEMA